MAFGHESGKNLPPGLWLPTADEPTAKYLAANFDQKDNPPDIMLDLGRFVVGLAFYQADKTGRVSLMPTGQDFDEIYAEGYGMPRWRLKHNGTLPNLQARLGFYPKGYEPSASELINRCRWAASYAYYLDPLPVDDLDLPTLLTWGSARHLTPSVHKTSKIMDGNTDNLRKILQMERRNHRHPSIFADIYRFGARVIEEHGGPISVSELNGLYPDVFVGMPSHTISHFMGGFTQFWEEYGFFPGKSFNLSPEQMVNIAVRRQIIKEDLALSEVAINHMSRDRRFFSVHLIRGHFRGGLTEFQDRVSAEYQHFLQLKSHFGELGVSDEVMQAICQNNFEASPEFVVTLRSHLNVLRKLSRDWYSAHYVLDILSQGFDLLDDRHMAKQLNEFKSALWRLDITDAAEWHFVFTCVPRINAEEALKGQDFKTRELSGEYVGAFKLEYASREE